MQLLAGRLGSPQPGSLLPGGVAVGPPWLEDGHPLRGVEEALRRGTHCEVCFVWGGVTRRPGYATWTTKARNKLD